MTIERAKEILLEILFPELCAGCKAPLPKASRAFGICKTCMVSAEIKTAFTCAECGARLPAQAGLPEGKKTCHPRVPFLLAAAGSYENELLKSLVYKLKYGRKTAYGRPLGTLIARHLENLNLDLKSYEIVPIPLHASRERERGFNQSRIIAEFLSENTGVKLSDKNILKRIRNTPPQAELGRKERLENIKGSFEIEPNATVPPYVILLDDVFTSGATMTEAVNTLRAAGVKKIIAVVAAKA